MVFLSAVVAEAVVVAASIGFKWSVVEKVQKAPLEEAEVHGDDDYHPGSRKVGFMVIGVYDLRPSSWVSEKRVLFYGESAWFY